MDGQLEFYDTDSSDFTLMASPEHSMATDLEWDPTGRYVVTSVSYWSQKVCTLLLLLYCYIRGQGGLCMCGCTFYLFLIAETSICFKTSISYIRYVEDNFAC